MRTIRDYLAPDISKIVIDNEEEFDELKSYFEERGPEAVELLELHSSKQPVFEKYGIEGEIEELFERQVKLPSGGYLVIDQTEALVAIDVNSGRSTRENDHEATVYKTNLEAAKEVARQLRLRDMGGIIVVDLIDMVNRRHDREVERVVREAMKDDKARVKIGRISENGTLEITRQRLRQAHRLISHSPCPHCAGTGLVRDPRGLAVRALRELSNKVSKTAVNLARMTVRLPVDVANLLTNTKRRELLELGDEHQLLIDVVADARLQGNEIRYEEERRGKAGLDAAQSVRDPRLERGRGRGRSRGGRPEAAPGASFGPTVSPPSIGPVPTFLHDEASILEADARDAAEELERERLTAERIANGEVRTPIAAELAPLAADGGKKRRRRRRRRKKGPLEGQAEGQNGSVLEGAEEGEEDEEDADEAMAAHAVAGSSPRRPAELLPTPLEHDSIASEEAAAWAAVKHESAGATTAVVFDDLGTRGDAEPIAAVFEDVIEAAGTDTPAAPKRRRPTKKKADALSAKDGKDPAEVSEV